MIVWLTRDDRITDVVDVWMKEPYRNFEWDSPRDSYLCTLRVAAAKKLFSVVPKTENDLIKVRLTAKTLGQWEWVDDD